MRPALVTVGAAATALATDQLTKLVVERSLDEGERASIPGVLRRSNRGPFSQASSVAASTLAVGMAAASVAFHKSPIVHIGAGITAGAMLSNIVDRSTNDHAVTDFITTGLGIINVADLLIGTGIIVGAIGLMRR